MVGVMDILGANKGYMGVVEMSMGRLVPCGADSLCPGIRVGGMGHTLVYTGWVGNFSLFVVSVGVWGPVFAWEDFWKNTS